MSLNTIPSDSHQYWTLLAKIFEFFVSKLMIRGFDSGTMICFCQETRKQAISKTPLSQALFSNLCPVICFLHVSLSFIPYLVSNMSPPLTTHCMGSCLDINSITF